MTPTKVSLNEIATSIEELMNQVPFKRDFIEKHFVDIYIHNKSSTEDFHTEFAESIHVERQVAKKLALAMLINSKFIRVAFADHYKSENLVFVD